MVITTQQEVIKRASKRLNLSRKKIQESFDLIELIMKQEILLADKDCSLKMCDLQFNVKNKEKRTMIMPTTKTEITVEPHKLLNIKTSSDWKRILHTKLED